MIVSHAAKAVRAHAERCREHPRSESQNRWSRADFAVSPACHRFFRSIAGTVLISIDPTLIICKGGGIFAMQRPEIFAPTVTVTAMK